MNVDLATQIVSMTSARTQGSIQMAMLKKSNDMQTDLINTLMQTALAAPQAGQGARIDKLA